MEAGTLVKNTLTGELGVVVSVKIWHAKPDDNLYTPRYYTKGNPSVDYYVHWLSGTTTWIISENVTIVD
jgi:hypothetical protein